jgi:hypothetical protein
LERHHLLFPHAEWRKVNMVIIEPPKKKTVTPSQKDVDNIVDAEWREIGKWEEFIRNIKKAFR